MKMPKLIAFAALCFICISCFSQNVSLGLKAGACIPNLKGGSSDNPVSSGWSSRFGPVGGIIFDYDFSKKISLRTELNYSSQGGKKNGVQAIATSNFGTSLPPGTPKYVYAKYKNVVKLNYLELPVMLHYTMPIHNNLMFFVNGGPYAALLLTAKSVSSGSDKIYKDPQRTEPLINNEVSFAQDIDIKNELGKFNAGIQGGIGLTLNYDTCKFFFTVGGNYGMIPIQINKDNGDNNTGALVITVGYTFSL